MLSFRAEKFGGELGPIEVIGVREGGMVGFRSNSKGVGTYFRVYPAPASAWPDTPDVTLEAYRDPVENFVRTMVKKAVDSAGGLSGIPGGSAVFTAAFNKIFPESKVSLFDLVSRFRADILRDVKNLIATNTNFQAKGALQNARHQYLITY